MHNKNKTTILTASIMLTAILLTGSITLAYAGSVAFDESPDPCNVNAISIKVSATAKGTVADGQTIEFVYDLDNRSTDPIPDGPDVACEVVLTLFLVDIDDDPNELPLPFQCAFDLVATDLDDGVADGGLTILSEQTISDRFTCVVPVGPGQVPPFGEE